MMVRPLSGEPVPFGDYFTKGNLRLHAIGILGGVIWNVGMSFSIIACDGGRPGASYGLGQGATMIGAFWGVFIWKEFKRRPARHQQTPGRHVRLLPARPGNPHRIETLMRAFES